MNYTGKNIIVTFASEIHTKTHANEKNSTITTCASDACMQQN